MRNCQLKGGKLLTKAFIFNSKEKSSIRKIIYLLLGIFLFNINTNAQEQSIKVGSATRNMIVYAPAGIEQNRPLVISMHGMNQTMYDQRNQTQFQSVAAANNFVLVFPQSNGTQWALWGTDDIDFILAIIDEMYKQYGIDRDRVYLSGFSMGGMMTYYAATKIADKIAAYAPVSGFLMSGPDTNSSRPIPIIHVHGADDTYVPHSSVQTHMDAWIKRNSCPTTAVVTSPYPANIPGSLSTKKYWGPGKEGVEVVFISVAGVGHWYSDNPNGVFTSQEIWDFCKKYSLKYGIPQFRYASVTDKNPKQIQVVLSESIVDSAYFNGFVVKIDGQAVAIDSVVLGDTNQLLINLYDSILKGNDITLSYSNGNGNVYSFLKKELLSFNDTLVDNLLKGASPRIIKLETNVDGNALIAKFNMKMLIPSDISALALSAEYNGQISVPILQGSYLNSDSTILVFPLDTLVYRDYILTLSYSGNSIISADSGLLKTISGLSVTNNANGLPVHIVSGKVLTDGITLSLEFSKPMALKVGQSGYFALYRNGNKISFNDYSISKNFIQLTLSKSVHYGDTATLSYTTGNIKAADNGPLDVFSDLAITNQVNAPVWKEIPGKIEAEDYTFKYGMQTETTGDAGGGLNLGYIGNGNWLEYTIENNTSLTDYLISFRVAAPSAGGEINYYVDDVSAGSINVPSTGNWQVYKSVDNTISISPGKHYLKVVATVSGFNLNYIDIHEKQSGIKDLTETDITIYPNPLSDELNISSPGFHFNKIEIFDLKGNLLLTKSVEGETDIHFNVNLPDGLYFIKISNDTKYLMKKILVDNMVKN